jgi:outer membrane murein-binding lipoprotein Lpp
VPQRLISPVALVAIAAVLASGCSSQPATCEEVADRTIVLAQDLIDDVEREFADQSLEDIIDMMRAGEELPSVSKFEARADDLSERAAELGCSQDELQTDVVARAGQLEATTELGEFIIDAIERGGL